MPTITAAASALSLSSLVTAQISPQITEQVVAAEAFTCTFDDCDVDQEFLFGMPCMPDCDYIDESFNVHSGTSGQLEARTRVQHIAYATSACIHVYGFADVFGTTAGSGTSANCDGGAIVKFLFDVDRPLTYSLEAFVLSEVEPGSDDGTLIQGASVAMYGSAGGDIVIDELISVDHEISPDSDALSLSGVLAPGQYVLEVRYGGQVLTEFQKSETGAGHSMVQVDLRFDATATPEPVEIAMEVLPDQSPLTATLEFPGGESQEFPLQMHGTMNGTVTFGCDNQCWLQLDGMELAPTESDFDVDIPGMGTQTLTVTDAVISAPGGSGLLTPVKGSPDDWDVLLPDYEITVASAPDLGGIAGQNFWTFYLSCGGIIDLCNLFGTVSCEKDHGIQEESGETGGVEGTKGKAHLTFPDIDFTTPIDLGLGSMNPTLSVTGTLTADVALDGCAPADLNCDGVVGPSDLAQLLGNWGPCGNPDNCSEDLNGDGVVDPADLAILLGNWG